MSTETSATGGFGDTFRFNDPVDGGGGLVGGVSTTKGFVCATCSPSLSPLAGVAGAVALPSTFSFTLLGLSCCATSPGAFGAGRFFKIPEKFGNAGSWKAPLGGFTFFSFTAGGPVGVVGVAGSDGFFGRSGRDGASPCKSRIRKFYSTILYPLSIRKNLFNDKLGCGLETGNIDEVESARFNPKYPQWGYLLKSTYLFWTCRCLRLR